jgi:hypothetical protein
MAQRMPHLAARLLERLSIVQESHFIVVIDWLTNKAGFKTG